MKPIVHCDHPRASLDDLGIHWRWCSKCGAIRRLGDNGYIGSWQNPDGLIESDEEFHREILAYYRENDALLTPEQAERWLEQ